MSRLPQSQPEAIQVSKNFVVYKFEDGVYSAAENDQWMNGLYDSMEACQYARKFSNADLRKLWEKLNPNRPSPDTRYISVEDLK